MYMTYDKENEKMKIAVTYENEQIFQHFGHSKQFKIYNVEDKKKYRVKLLIQTEADMEP